MSFDDIKDYFDFSNKSSEEKAECLTVWAIVAAIIFFILQS